MAPLKKVQDILVNRVIFILSLAGIAIAVYVLQSWLRQAPVICLNGSGCDLVRKSPASYLFGVIPVPAVGLVGYSILAILAFWRTTLNPQSSRFSVLSSRLLTAMLALAAFGVAFVSWFTYTELFVIRAVCTWCAISAANMVIIFVLLLIGQIRLMSPM